MKFYEKQYKTNLQVGIFVVLGILILVFGALWFSNYLESGKMTALTIAFDDVSGLERGDGVLIMGVNRGKVNDIILQGSSVLVKISVKLDQPLKEGTRFLLRNTSLMGSTRVIIDPGEGRNKIDTSLVQTGLSLPGISALAGEAGEIITEVKVLLGQLNGSQSIISKFSVAADSLQKAILGFNQILDDNQANLHQTTGNLSIATQNLAELLEDNKTSIDSTLAGSNELVANLSAASDSFQVLSRHFSDLALQMQDKKSTFGQLTTDDELYLQLQSSIASLDSLLKDIKQNPKRYLSVDLF